MWKYPVFWTEIKWWAQPSKGFYKVASVPVELINFIFKTDSVANNSYRFGFMIETSGLPGFLYAGE